MAQVSPYFPVELVGVSHCPLHMLTVVSVPKTFAWADKVHTQAIDHIGTGLAGYLDMGEWLTYHLMKDDGQVRTVSCNGFFGHGTYHFYGTGCGPSRTGSW
jgi:hypothetical protein